MAALDHLDLPGRSAKLAQGAIPPPAGSVDWLEGSSMLYDLIVIGGGVAGEKGAAQAAYFGKRVALIEQSPVLGGAVANTSIPFKALRETALYLAGFRTRNLRGIDIQLKERPTLRDFMSQEHALVRDFRFKVANNLDQHDVDIFPGRASFVDPHTVKVEHLRRPPTLLSAEVILIACGSRPYRPPPFDRKIEGIYDSNTFMHANCMPRRLAIVGGGPIGCEYASILSLLGCSVTLIDGNDAFLPFLDSEVSTLLQQSLSETGVDMLLASRVESVSGGPPFTLALDHGQVVEADTIVVAAGRTGNTDGLALENAGLAADARGLLTVNERFQTAQPHIRAAGDVIGFPALASTSMEQARMAMIHAFDLKYRQQTASLRPYGIYTIPECSMVGATEDSAQREGTRYVAGRARYRDNARGGIIGDDAGFLKLIFAADDMRLIGAHMLGEQAIELINIGLLSMETGGTFQTFIDACFNFPSLAELYKYATYDAMKRRQQGRMQGIELAAAQVGREDLSGSRIAGTAGLPPA
jgi:NAD(P) transhydrogenase